MNENFIWNLILNFIWKYINKKKHFAYYFFAFLNQMEN